MIRKIIYILLSLSILAGGYIASGKLGYFERSAAIFKLNSAVSFNGQGGRGFRGERDFRDGQRRARPDFRQLPDSIRQRFENRRESFGHGEKGESRQNFHGGFRANEAARGMHLNLRNVSWFLLVFASFTVIVVYFDKAYRHLRRKRITPAES